MTWSRDQLTVNMKTVHFLACEQALHLVIVKSRRARGTREETIKQGVGERIPRPLTWDQALFSFHFRSYRECMRTAQIGPDLRLLQLSLGPSRLCRSLARSRAVCFARSNRRLFAGYSLLKTFVSTSWKSRLKLSNLRIFSHVSQK